MAKRNYFRQHELDAVRSEREQVVQEYERGFAAGRNEDPAPDDTATLAFRTGYNDAVELRNK